jgi:adenylate cyclase class 2
MVIEIEKKYQLTAEQYEKAALKFNEVGAIFSHEDFEINELYAGGTLEGKEAVLRIRKIGEKTLLTYKERVENSAAIKQQIEYETEVCDRMALEKIIESLGFQKAIVYEKRRRTWRLNEVEIVLDELPFGLFMEIEGSIAEINIAETLLEAQAFHVEHATYPQLTKKLGEQAGKTFVAIFR